MSLGFSNIFDLDMYSRRISFFYRGKEKITSKFGYFLTLLYIVISITLFLIYFIRTISREDVTASDSTIYTEEIPSLEINQDIFNIAFGIEHPVTINRFIDETIYYPKVYYYENVKVNGKFKNKITKEIKAEKCNNIKFGKKFKNLLGKDHLNNSYCFNDYNYTLKGGYKYDEIGYVKIFIYPCVNDTNNNNHCKPRYIIDQYFNKNHFSILAGDTALNPDNYTNPGIPILMNTYTNIDKFMKKDYIVKYTITEIETDRGLFINDIKKEKYLKFTKDFDQTFIVDENYYLSGNEILTMTIRLEDNIYFQKRTYKKMAEVFATTGGYMQLIYSIFALISLLTKTMNIEKKLLNSLFYFNIKQKKVILSIEYKKKLNYTTTGAYAEKTDDEIKGIRQITKNFEINRNSNFIPYLAKKSPMLKKYSKYMKNEKNNSKKDKLILSLPRKSVSYAKGIKLQKLFNGQNDASIDGFINNSINQNNSKQKNKISHKVSFNQEENNLNMLQINRLYIRSKSTDSDNLKKLEKENFCNITFNLFEYYCFWKYTNKKVQIELFKFAYKFFKSQMDIINFFNIIILTQIMMKKQSNEKNNFLSEIVELSM